MIVTAAVARHARAPFSLAELEMREPAPDEVLVRIVGVGVCHTDLIARDQFIPIALPSVLGHEGAGVVERVGAKVTKVGPGDKVVLSFRSCGACARCDAHEPSYCQRFPELNYAGVGDDGQAAYAEAGQPVSSHFFGQSSFASHALTFERNCVKIVDDDTPLALLGPLGCGLQTGAGGVMRSLAARAGSSIVIFGGGAVGLSAVMGAVIQGCAIIIVVEPHAARRDLALELGATHVIDPGAGPVAEAVRAIVPAGMDYAFETSGAEPAIAAGLACLGSRGVLGLVGVPPRPDCEGAYNIAGLITYGHSIKGIIEGDSDPDVFIPELIDLHKKGRFPFDRLIKTYPFKDINQALEDQHAGLCVKVVLTF
jgi:aryl-alcohol dehydrogenase